jgi:hypothetical protein
VKKQGIQRRKAAYILYVKTKNIIYGVGPKNNSSGSFLSGVDRFSVKTEKQIIKTPLLFSNATAGALDHPFMQRQIRKSNHTSICHHTFSSATDAT